MIVGLILVGSVIGAFAALGALVLGQGVLMALLIYAGTGCACVLALALCVALRPDDPAPEAECRHRRGCSAAEPPTRSGSCARPGQNAARMSRSRQRFCHYIVASLRS